MDKLALPCLVASAALGALLSFTLEPLVGRLVAPSFGGAVHVWAVCLMVFQGTLLLAYAWAHLVAPRIGAGHLLALALAALWLPIGFSATPAPDAPLATLVLRLVVTVVVPFWALSTTAVVVQSWLAASALAGARDPYPLYGASNLGSLVGLVAYPTVVEPLFGLQTQRLLWSCGYLGYLVVVATTWLVLRPRPVSTALARVPLRAVVSWTLLAAGPSALLLAVTNIVANEIGSFPLVWTVPLALYLGSFVVTFRAGQAGGWARTWWPHGLLVLFPFTVEQVVAPWSVVVLYGAFFFVCLLFHGALYRLRPEPRRLTAFYLAVAGGGWLGGLAVSLGAPALLDGPWDGPLVVAAMALVGRVVLGDPFELFSPPKVFAVVGLPIVVFIGMQQPYVARYRSFYGLYSIEERPIAGVEPHRRIVHGTTVHGIQYLDEERDLPLAYHHRGGPLHEAWELRRGGRMAVLGLGAGAMAAWTRPGETLVFYEIDPANEPIARRWFTYLERAAGRVEVRVGDARLLMQTEADRRPYDVLLVDAFAGDSIPMHLATVEAFEVWTSRLTDEGLLILNLSSRYTDLRPILDRIAAEAGWACLTRFGVADPREFADPLATPTAALACAADDDRLAVLRGRGWDELDSAAAPLWTDDWNPVLTAAVRW
jgi:hypothetical protein